LVFRLGETLIKLRLRRDPSAEWSTEMCLLVDTGATYSWISSDILRKINIQPSGSKRFKTIKADILQRDTGFVFVEYEGEIAPTVVVFAEKGDASVFGLHGLESLGLEVDPVTRQVRKSEALLALAVP